MTPEIKERIAQIRRGEVPEGYKRAKYGIFPVLWDEKNLKNSLKISQRERPQQPMALHGQKKVFYF